MYQNIELVLLLNGNKSKDIKEKVIELRKKVDLYKYYGIESERDGMIVTVNGVVVEG